MIAAILTGLLCALALAAVPKLPLLRSKMADKATATESEWVALEWKSAVILIGCAVLSAIVVFGFKAYARSARLSDPVGPAVIAVSIVQLLILVVGLGVAGAYGSKAKKLLAKNSMAPPVRVSKALQIGLGIVGWVAFFILIRL